MIIPQKIVEQLGLRIRSHQVARYANGFEESIEVTEPVLIQCQGRETVDEAVVVGDEVMLGQVILEKKESTVSPMSVGLPNTVQHPIDAMPGYLERE